MVEISLPWMEKTSSKNGFLKKTPSKKRLFGEDFIQKPFFWTPDHWKNVFLDPGSSKKRFFGPRIIEIPFLDPGSLKKRFFGPRITEKVFFWTPDHWKSVFLDPGSMVYGPWSILAIIFPEKSTGVLFFTIFGAQGEFWTTFQRIRRKRNIRSRTGQDYGSLHTNSLKP